MNRMKQIMKRVTDLLTSFALLALLSGCDVHEWPEQPETVPLLLKLEYETDLPVWEHSYSGRSVKARGMVTPGVSTWYAVTRGGTNQGIKGKIRYLIRVYPRQANNGGSYGHVEEFLLYKELGQGYNYEVRIDLPPGDYTVMVWSDLLEKEGDTPFYNANNFGEITFQNGHKGNTDYRDAFSGKSDVSLTGCIFEREAETLTVSMTRPLAKFEFITTDLLEFLENELTRVTMKNGGQPDDGDVTRSVNLDTYKVQFHYVGFMPDAYSLFTGKPVDSSTGVSFETTLKRLNDAEASLGFDYVFMNSGDSSVSVQLAIYDNEGTPLSVTDPIEVPLKRSSHTIMRGKFLTSETSGGIHINPDYDGDHNLIIP